MNLDSLPNPIRWAVEAAQDKKATAVTVLSLTGLGAFVEYFVICSAESVRQIDAIGEEVEGRLHTHGVHFPRREGRAGTEWLLLDYGNFIVHIFTEKMRLFYDIERLWRSAKRFDVPEPGQSQASGAAS
ncbi:MAG TPA: ribosome silencing factor [Candidatus Acidoferrales bacterium]|nr:ribosome silencing factor [Candidatus Acidoferrales bacterium]